MFGLFGLVCMFVSFVLVIVYCLFVVMFEWCLVVLRVSYVVIVLLWIGCLVVCCLICLFCDLEFVWLGCLLCSLVVLAVCWLRLLLVRVIGLWFVIVWFVYDLLVYLGVWVFGRLFVEDVICFLFVRFIWPAPWVVGLVLPLFGWFVWFVVGLGLVGWLCLWIDCLVFVLLCLFWLLGFC